MRQGNVVGHRRYTLLSFIRAKQEIAGVAICCPVAHGIDVVQLRLGTSFLVVVMCDIQRTAGLNRANNRACFVDSGRFVYVEHVVQRREQMVLIDNLT